VPGCGSDGLTPLLLSDLPRLASGIGGILLSLLKLLSSRDRIGVSLLLVRGVGVLLYVVITHPVHPLPLIALRLIIDSRAYTAPA
jgi:hypothetical protein